MGNAGDELIFLEFIYMIFGVDMLVTDSILSNTLRSCFCRRHSTYGVSLALESTFSKKYTISFFFYV